MPNLTATDFKVFLPAKDFALSLEFYQALGATTDWVHEGSLAQLKLAGQRFLIQNYYVKALAHNFMIYVNVEDADAWHAMAQSLVDSGRFPGVRAQAPEQKDWGDRVGYIWDPSGVLIHIAQWAPKS